MRKSEVWSEKELKSWLTYR